MDFQFSTPTLATPVLADTEFRARLKRGFDHAGGNGSSGNTHVFGTVKMGTPVGRRIADSLCRPYGLIDVDSVNDAGVSIDCATGLEIERLFYVGDSVRLITTKPVDPGLAVGLVVGAGGATIDVAVVEAHRGEELNLEVVAPGAVDPGFVGIFEDGTALDVRVHLETATGPTVVDTVADIIAAINGTGYLTATLASGSAAELGVALAETAIVSFAAWSAIEASARTVATVDSANQRLTTDGAAFAAWLGTTDGVALIAASLITAAASVGAPITVMAPPEGVNVGENFKTWTMATDDSSLTPAVRGVTVSWGSILKRAPCAGIHATGPATTLEGLLTAGDNFVAMAAAGVGYPPPVDSDGNRRYPSLTFDPFAVNN